LPPPPRPTPFPYTTLFRSRLLGEPGVGKTRMALELTRADNLAPVTLYLRDGRALLKSSFLNELIQDHAYHFVVLVVDECPQKDRDRKSTRLNSSHVAISYA